MIISFLHKGLEKFYRNGSVAGIQSKHRKRLRLILTNLDHARSHHDMDLPGLYLHALKGKRQGIWSVRCLLGRPNRAERMTTPAWYPATWVNCSPPAASPTA